LKHSAVEVSLKQHLEQIVSLSSPSSTWVESQTPKSPALSLRTQTRNYLCIQRPNPGINNTRITIIGILSYRRSIRMRIPTSLHHLLHREPKARPRCRIELPASRLRYWWHLRWWTSRQSSWPYNYRGSTRAISYRWMNQSDQTHPPQGLNRSSLSCRHVIGWSQAS